MRNPKKSLLWSVLILNELIFSGHLFATPVLEEPAEQRMRSSDEGLVKDRVRQLLAGHLYLSASRELITFLEWHPDGSVEIGRQLEEIQDAQRRILEGPKTSLLDRYYAEGYDQFFNGDPDLAIQAWKRFLGLSGADPSGFERSEEVRGFLTSLQAREGGRRGLQALRDGRFEEAERWLEQSFRLLPDEDVRAGLERAQAATREQQRKAEKKIRQRNVDQLVRRGRRLYDRGDALGARRAFMEVLQWEPGNPEAKRYLTLVENLLGTQFDPEKAREYYKEGLRAYHLGQFVEARGLWETALRLDPTSDLARSSLKRLPQEATSEAHIK